MLFLVLLNLSPADFLSQILWGLILLVWIPGLVVLDMGLILSLLNACDVPPIEVSHTRCLVPVCISVLPILFNLAFDKTSCSKSVRFRSSPELFAINVVVASLCLWDEVSSRSSYWRAYTSSFIILYF